MKKENEKKFATETMDIDELREALWRIVDENAFSDEAYDFAPDREKCGPAGCALLDFLYSNEIMENKMSWRSAAEFRMTRFDDCDILRFAERLQLNESGLYRVDFEGMAYVVTDILEICDILYPCIDSGQYSEDGDSWDDDDIHAMSDAEVERLSSERLELYYDRMRDILYDVVQYVTGDIEYIYDHVERYKGVSDDAETLFEFVFSNANMAGDAKYLGMTECTGYRHMSDGEVQEFVTRLGLNSRDQFTAPYETVASVVVEILDHSDALRACINTGIYEQ